ncbi:MAG: MFS transporter [Halomonas sp.]|uniref:MFS transporter n=1 Tax=Halomonas sp. TaxID=1486246 RepID=UPI003F8F8B7A
MNSQFALLTKHRFLPFFLTQFLGAFNDNLYKNALVVLITFHAVRYTPLEPGVLVNLAAGIFILPFFLFSATAGQLADKYEKSRLIRGIKLLELGIMVLAASAFALDSLVLMLVTLFFMGVQSSLFGPVKYAILPQHLDEAELIGGNGLVESGTFVAILIGTIAGGVMIALPDGARWVSVAVLLIAGAGYLASWGIPTAAAADAALRINWNPLSQTLRTLSFARANRVVFLSILGISWLWFYGALLLSQFPDYARSVLGGDEYTVTLLLAIFSVGIGTGSLLCEKLSKSHVEIGLVPFGAIGLTLFGLDLWWASPAAGALGSLQPLSAVLGHAVSWRVVFDLLMIGIFGGFFIVPLYALIQLRSDASHRSRIIAGNNILNALFMVFAALMGAGLLAAGASIAQLIFITAILNACVAIYIFTLVPEFLLRFIVWLLVHAVYRLRVNGEEYIPGEGAVVLVANHVSFVDALVIMATCRRPVRFVMDHRIFRWPILSFVFRTSRAIPIAPAREDAEMMERAFDSVAAALEAGEVVGIFPEGAITKSGEIRDFRGGISRIVERTPVPVVPMALSGLWGSFFSRKGGSAMRKPFRRGMFNRIGLNIGPPLAAATVSPDALRAQVVALRGDQR